MVDRARMIKITPPRFPALRHPRVITLAKQPLPEATAA
jgi:hypothetical protein